MKHLKYYEIIPIRDENYSIFDTICYIGECANLDVTTTLSYLGFDSCKTAGGLLATLLRKKDEFPYFGIDQYMINKLNRFCIEMSLPVRVVRSDRRKVHYGSIGL